jgi:dipicolinate synthase subunit B
MSFKDLHVGFAVTGSFCTFAKVLPAMEELVWLGARVQPIFSPVVCREDTRFFKADDFRQRVQTITGNVPWSSFVEVEPIGPKGLLDLLLIAPCTGNTMGKLAQGIIDTPVAMAAKSHLRNDRPVVLAISTNDGLTGSAANLGLLLNRKHFYFVPFGQDDPKGKPHSLVAHMDQIVITCQRAIQGQQLEPLLCPY